MFDCLATIIGHEGRVWHASWSLDGNKIVSCGEDRTIRVWVLNTDNIQSYYCAAILEDSHSRAVRCCEWSPNGRMIASASFDGTVIVWSAQDGPFTSWDRIATLEGHENEVKSVSWSSDGLYLASCGRDKKIWIWEKLERNDFECSAVLDGHSQDVKFVVFHPSENVLFSTGYDDTIKIWAEDSGDWYCQTTLIGHNNTIWGLALDFDGDCLVSCSADLSLILWQRESKHDPKKNWKRVSTLRNLHDYPIYSVDWSKMNASVISAGGDNKINLLSYGKGDDGFGILLLQYSKVQAHEGDVNCVRWNPSYNSNFNGVFLSTSDDGMIKLWRTTDY